MKKKEMQDMKPRGVRITQILKKDIDPGMRAASENIRVPDVVIGKSKEDIVEEKVPIKSNTPKDFAYRPTRDFEKKIFGTPRMPKNKNNIPKSLATFFIITLFVGGVYWVSYLLQNAKITITQKRDSFTLNHKQFDASSDPSSSKAEFQIMIVTDNESKDVTLTDSENVSLKAQGVITLYNAYSTKTQNLLIHTLVSDSKGKTYQTDKAVSIPGYTQDSDKNVIPGQIDVGITAFLPGDAYNGSPNDFSINGYKGTTKATKIYGKLKTPITGGAEGLVYIVGPEDKGNVNATAVSSFKDALIKKVNAQVPDGYILYPNAMQFAYETNTNVLSPTPNGKIVISGTMSSVILKKQSLQKSVIKSLLPDISDSEVSEIDLPNINNLSFNFVNQDQVITKDLSSIIFTLTGPLSAIWYPNIDTLRTAITGIPKSKLLSIFKLDPGIASASVRVFPPWQPRLPDNPTRIHINVK